MSAVFSPDRRHRYVLTDPDYQPGLFPSKRIALWCLHNPSVADGVRRPDPTSGRVNSFSKRFRMDIWTIINPLAYVAQEKDDLLTCDDPVGPENDRHIKEQLARVGKDGILILGWGNMAPRFQPRIDQVMALIAASGVTPMCLGKNNNGSPKHPLYLGGMERPVPF